MSSSWLATVGLAAAVLGVSTSLPQVWRLLRSPGAEGLSLASAVLGALSAATWLTYGALQVDMPQIVANVPGLAGATAVAVLVLRRTTTRPVHVVAACAGWALVVLAVWAVAGPVAVGTAATAVSLVARAPQVREVFVAPSLAGVSPLSFGLSVTACTLWAVYGVGTGQVPVWASSVLAGAMSLVVVVGTTVRTTSPATAPTAAPTAASTVVPAALPPRASALAAARHEEESPALAA
jgi:uncharacterized protein with PQ loop repeat